MLANLTACTHRVCAPQIDYDPVIAVFAGNCTESLVCETASDSPYGSFYYCSTYVLIAPYPSQGSCVSMMVFALMSMAGSIIPF